MLTVIIAFLLIFIKKKLRFLSVFVLIEELPLTFLICLMVMITLILCFSEKDYLFYFHFWRIFSLYGTLGQLSILSILQMTLHCLLACVVSDEKSAVTSVSVPLCMKLLLSLAATKSFLLFKGQSWLLSLQYFFSSVISFFFWYPNYTYIRDLILSHSLWMLLFYFFILLYLCFPVCVISTALSSRSLILSLICVKSTDEPSEGILHLCYWH